MKKKHYISPASVLVDLQQGNSLLAGSYHGPAGIRRRTVNNDDYDDVSETVDDQGMYTPYKVWDGN